ncbi:MAG: PilW family protein [Betaproteobacteria bacterium]
MTRLPNPLPARLRQQGAGLIETMIGILIGLLVVIVVYNLLSVAEGFKRMTTGVADAQVTGLLSQFVAARDAGNGGNGISLAAPSLVDCADQDLRPVPVRITAGATATDSDSFISTHSGAPRVLWPVPLLTPTSTPTSGDPFAVQTPLGFLAPDGTVMPTVAKPYYVIVTDGAGSWGGNCRLVKVTGATTPPDAQGGVTLTFDAAPAGTFTGGAAGSARVIILGPEGLATRLRYEVFNTSANANCSAANAQGCQLVTTNLMPPAGARTPIAQNVVLLKAQYGVDTNNDRIIDCWTAADAANTCADGKDYSNIADPGSPAPDVSKFPYVEDLNRILAVRIGVVVRSDEPDVKLLDPSVVGTARTTSDGVAGLRQPMYLFNCAANDATCQSRVLLPGGPTASLGSPSCSPALICDGWRYRAYETVVPLRNAIFNSTL